MTEAAVVPLIAAGSSVACVRSLGRRGVRVIGIGSPPYGASRRSKYCTERVVVPRPNDDLAGYGDALLNTAAREDVVTVVPLREADSYVLTRRRDEFAEHIATPWVDGDTFELVRDRTELVEHARNAGVAVPETTLVDAWDGWADRTVVKPRYSLLPVDGCAVATEPRFFRADARPDAETVADIEREMGHTPIAQEYVPGNREHGFFALCVRGKPMVTFQHRRVRSYSYAGGASVYRKAVDIPNLERAGRRLLSKLDWHGPAMVEFKHDPRDDSFKLLEVNPRFWGSLALASCAGVDFPWYYYELATDRLAEPNDDYATDVGCHLLRGEVSYLASVLRDGHDHVDPPSLPSALWEVGRSLIADRHFDYLDAGDPWPFVYDVAGAAWDVIR